MDGVYSSGQESELAARRADYDRRMNGMVELGGGKVAVYGAKPRPGEAGVRITQVPAAHPQESLAIRFFDGGLALRGQYMFDLFDLRSKTALNMPDGLVFYPHFRPGQVPFLGHVMSWEEAGRMAKSDIPAGEERFSLPEGVVVELRRPGMPPFYFEVPVREVVSSVNPATSIPFSM